MDFEYLIYNSKKTINMELFRLDEILEELNISKQQLADSVGLSRTNLYNYLSNENATIKILDKISKTVRLPIAELFNKEGKSIIGYVEFNNFIYKISSPADFELVIEDFKKYFSKNNPKK